MMILEVQAVVAKHYNISMDILVGPSREARYVEPRHVAIYLARTLTGKSMPMIAKKFGDRHPTSILDAIRKIGAQRLTDKSLDAELGRLERVLKTGR